MDIAITLPLDLWKKVVAGEKSIELRKNFPKEFNVKTDRVYVIIKGTRHIAGYFMVSAFEAFHVKGISDLYPFLTKIAVPKQWVIGYWAYSPMVYFWHVRDVIEFSKPIDREYYWKMQSNPQSFVYLR